MARETRQQVLNRIDNSADDQNATRETLSTLASGMNPDGSVYILPVQEQAKTPLPAPAADVAGVATAPTAAQVVADTGALAAGDYRFEIEMGISDTVAVGKDLRVEHRNAANNANQHIGALCPAGGSSNPVVSRRTIAANERVRVITGAVAGAASSTYGAAIRAYLLT